jgi:exopolysaccharide biosynthesis WecB/TagA/CpsF family protein/anti-anti-sigma factor
MTDKLREPRLVFLLGIPFHDVTMKETMEWIDTLVARGRPCYLASASLDFAAQASRDVELQRILFEAEMVLCDGAPLMWASRRLNAPLREQVAGPDLVANLLAHCARRGHSLFFLGSTHEALTDAVVRCRSQHPGIDICGVYSPPGAELLDLDNDEIARRIADAQPDILLVAMGCPKQEKWIYMNYQKLLVPVSIGVGDSLELAARQSKGVTGGTRRSGIGWIGELIRHPARLLSSQFLDLVFFVRALRRQRQLLQQRGSLFGSIDPVERTDAGSVVQVKLRGRIDAEMVTSCLAQEMMPEEGRPNVLIDCSDVTFMDSTGLGFLIKIFRACNQAGGTLVLLSPSETLSRMLSLLNLSRVIPVAQSAGEAHTLMQSSGPVRTGVKFFSQTAVLTIEIPGDITAATVANCEATLIEKWEATPWVKNLQIDLANVTFLDSSGLGFLVKALRLVKKREGGALELLNPSANVVNVIKLANLEAMFGLSA